MSELVRFYGSQTKKKKKLIIINKQDLVYSHLIILFYC